MIIQKNIEDKPVILIQEGMTEGEGLRYNLVKKLGLPRFIAGTATSGMSDAYQYFCIASDGYRDLFIKKAATPINSGHRDTQFR
jgi:hypothetical protein